jgi:hypothetical protein
MCILARAVIASPLLLIIFHGVEVEDQGLIYNFACTLNYL